MLLGFAKRWQAEDRAEKAETELAYTKQRLAQFEQLIAKLEKHDYCRFEPAGGVIGWDKKDEHLPECARGTAYCVPREYARLVWE